jgi:hypothetical protein
MIYLQMETLNELNDVRPSPEDQVASDLLALFILAINWFTGFLYPILRCVHAAVCLFGPSRWHACATHNYMHVMCCHF